MADIDSKTILFIFLMLKAGQYAVERWLGAINRRYWENKANLDHACETLGIGKEDIEKTVSYSRDKYQFGVASGFVSTAITFWFLASGGLGWFESWAKTLVGEGAIATGLVFFGLVLVAGMLLSLPFDYIRTFKIEEKHGFNRQTIGSFFGDKIKGLLIGVVLGAGVLSLILWIMESTGDIWWVYAWIVLTLFSVLTAWLYPTVLAPLFNKFSPVESGELKSEINGLADKVGFQTSGIFVMDASRRSSHGNAYFTGVFGKKRIVLFDNLVKSMSAKEVVAVLAHELGHFKLHHVRWQLIRGTLMTGLTFYLLGLCLPLEQFYVAFGLEGKSYYGGLLVFGLWFGLIDFILQPWENFLSRKNEFAADSFARDKIGQSKDLGDALLKLRETSNVMPISHPLFSKVYHSHPPLIERLQAMGYN